ncbi:MAG: DUF1759 domain-containing protein, partial [Candidatus Thiodiazotropha taylori]|nr:DUF1759 domain-containing protein [Candidatus Thiodiazotropha taylori]MCW4308796.1 DUF1759 domain-containing protein [Candidatus Thiodiazotropha endolucinida]
MESENRIDIENRGSIAGRAKLEMEFKKEKCRTKSNFTRSKNKLLLLIEDEEVFNRRDIHAACKQMDSCMEIVLEVLLNFSNFYLDHNELQKSQKIVGEMEKIEEDFHRACEAARECLESQTCDRSSVSSELLSIDLLERMTIRNDNSETYQKEKQLTAEPQTSYEVTSSNFDIRSPLPLSFKEKPSCSIHVPKYEAGFTISEHRHLQSNETPDNGRQRFTDNLLETTRNEDCKNSVMKQEFKPTGLNANAASFQSCAQATPTKCTPVANNEAPSIGQDLWRQLKRVQIPVFSGDKRTYQNWKAAFLACIDSAPATKEYKLLQLRQYLAGEALKAVESLGHSAVAYEAAKERLERKYGGKRRQIAIYLDELERFRQIRLGNARDLEEFADLLDVAMINLTEAGQHHELGDGSLYTKLQRKLPECMLARYHRWIFENDRSESVLTLRTWIIQESEFQTIASETVRGFTESDRNTHATQPIPKYRNQRTLFGETEDNSSLCQVCDRKHSIWSCHDFMQKSVSERWNIAKYLQLCFRCLGTSHFGKLCRRSRPCGINRCRQLHHKLLHQGDRQSVAYENALRWPSSTVPKVADAIEPNQEQRASGTLSVDPVTSGLEGKVREKETTMMIQDDCRPDFIALRTVPIIVKNGKKSLRVNALLDDASTKTYINTDVAAELGLQGKTESVKVNVLNGQIKTFNTSPVDIELESLSGDASVNVTAFTANRVTGDMEAVNWNKYKDRWPHLKNIQFDFQCTSTRPIVDLLIGLDCADLHHAIKEVRGRPGEPV